MALATSTEISSGSAPVVDSKGSVTWAMRAAAVLTTSYVASSHADCAAYRTFGLIVACDTVDYTSIELFVEGSLDAATWYEIPAQYQATTLGELAVTLANLSSATDGVFQIVSDVRASRYVRVSVKRTGGTATGTVAVTGVCGA